MSKGIEKSKSTRKAKAEARKLLTKFINQILQEPHGDPVIIDGDAVIVTKAEALARHIVKGALGYVETTDIIDDKTGKKLGRKETVVKPDKTYVAMVYERMEGRVPTVEVKETDSKPSVKDRVSAESKNRLNSLTKKGSLKS